MDIKANDPGRNSWLEVPENSDFPIQNIPFAIFNTQNTAPRACTRIGDQIIDLSVLAQHGYLDDANIGDRAVFKNQTLNAFMSLGRGTARSVRDKIADLFDSKNDILQSNEQLCKDLIFPLDEVQMLMPVQVPNYTDFYSSKEHATNVGTMFRDPDNALLPNWKHIPVGYHGRASSIIPSGVPIHRPKGQQKPNEDGPPVFGPCKLLDFELEMAFITCKNNGLGNSISTNDSEDYIFGMVLFNDWSARDIQKWEYVPLGPFLAKNFASSISPWVVTMDALEPFRTSGPVQDPEPLPYLQFKEDHNYDINLEALIEIEGFEPHRVCLSNYKYMYWNMVQQITHHAINGCNIEIGDMYASGTISGPDPSSFGSMLEISWRGTKPVKMPDGGERKFINDNDTVIMRGWAERAGVRIGFGEVRTKVLPAK